MFDQVYILFHFNIILQHNWISSTKKKQILCLRVYILVLVIGYGKRIFSAPYFIVICGLSGCTIFLPHENYKGHDFRGKKYGIEKCVLIFLTNLPWKICLFKDYTARISFKILMNLNFILTDFRKTVKYQISWKSVYLLHADRLDEANGCYSQFCEGP